MGATNLVLAVYAISAVLALACALLPGSSRFGRFLCVLAAFALVAWPASTFLLPPGYHLGKAVLVVPPIFLGYAWLTLRGHFASTTWVPGASADGGRGSAGQIVDRRSPNRRSLPGEFSDVPVNQAPERHDPWEALYAAAERERLRGGGGRAGRAAALPITPAPEMSRTAVASHAAGRSRSARPTTLTRLAFDTQPAWFLENIDEVSDFDRH